MAAHCEKQSSSSSHCPQVKVKPPCGLDLWWRSKSSHLKSEKKAARWRSDDVTHHHHHRVWGYTPSSMPMKSEPFCIVMEAPAALSTNMEVYCPACGGRDTAVMQKFDTNTHFHVCVSVCGSLTWSSSRPWTLTVKILLLLSNPTIISNELWAQKRDIYGLNCV